MPDAVTTADGRFVVIDGRRWRASDPGIPDGLRQELVDELMAARRGVAEARRASDGSGERASRRRVHDAKVALGERGQPWWEPTEAGTAERIDATIRTLLRHRTSSICPSDAARIVGAGRWRERLDDVRRRAGVLRSTGWLEITQGDRLVDATTSGPIRLRRGPAFDAGPTPTR